MFAIVVSLDKRCKSRPRVEKNEEGGGGSLTMGVGEGWPDTETPSKGRVELRERKVPVIVPTLGGKEA